MKERKLTEVQLCAGSIASLLMFAAEKNNSEYISFTKDDLKEATDHKYDIVTLMLALAVLDAIGIIKEVKLGMQTGLDPSTVYAKVDLEKMREFAAKGQKATEGETLH